VSLEIISAFGLGAIFTTILQSWFNVYVLNKTRSFQEKKDAYIGLLNAFYRLTIPEHAETAAKEFALWQMRCELVSPPRVRKAIQQVIDTDSDRFGATRHQAVEELKDSMQSDLGISK
jgi:hypothetical protein